MIDILNYDTNPNETNYKITNAAGLNKLSSLVNGGTTFSGRNIYLANDINFDSSQTNNFTPIGVYSITSSNNRTFNGTFDGNDFTISGINISTTSNYQSLLFVNLNNAVIRNLGLIDSTITGASYIGGFCENQENSTISNSYITGCQITGSSFIGAFNYLSINSTIDSCYNNSTIVGDNFLSGICVSCNASTITNSYNLSNISGDTYIGGVIVTAFNSSTIRKCYNSGNISGESSLGGVCTFNNSASNISCCYNSGSVIASSNSCGGICSDNVGTISNCYNSGTVSSSLYVGGISSFNEVSITNCYNLGDIFGTSSSTYVGGIVGLNSTTTGTPSATVTNCYNTGKVNSLGIDGGIAGRNSTSSIIRNTYYLNTSSTTGINIDSVGNGEAISYTANQLSTDSFAYNLNTTNNTESNSGAWSRVDNVNNGYPILSCISDTSAIYKLTIIPNDNGTISYNGISNGETFVLGGSTINLTVSPNTGYSLTNLIINGVSTSNSTGIFTVPDSDTTVQPVFTANAYSITTNLNGGTLNTGVTIPASYTINDLPITLPTASEISRLGYTFAGWYLTPDFSGSAISEIPEGTTGNITLYARWSPIVYTIVSVLNQGTLSPGVTIPTFYTVEDLPITLPTASEISRSGYTFDGWYLTPDFSGNSITEIAAGTTGTITIYAKWTPILYTITSQLNEGTLNPGITIPTSYTVEDLPITLPDASEISRLGFTFGGWYLNPTFSGNSISEISEGTTGDINIYAKWTADDYPITASLNGGTLNTGVTIPTSYTVTDLPITLPNSSEISRPGYTFAGWFLDPDFSGNTITEIAAGTTGHVFIYAKWIPIEYSITTELNNGTLNEGITIPSTYTDENLPITLPNATEISRPGYMFEGWFLDADFSGDPIYEILEGTTGNINLYAKWSLLEYDITAYYNGGNLAFGVTIPLSYNIEQLPILLPNSSEISRLGYTFGGWYLNTDFSGNPITEIAVGTTGHLFIYAKWIPIEYSITTKLNGGTLKEGVSIPTSYTLPDLPITLPNSSEISRPGYTFAGWFLDPDFSGNPITEIAVGTVGNITLYAKWIKNPSPSPETENSVGNNSKTGDSNKFIYIVSLLFLLAASLTTMVFYSRKKQSN